MNAAELQRLNAAYALQHGLVPIEAAIRAYLASYNLPHAKETVGQPRPAYQPSWVTAQPKTTQATAGRGGYVDLLTLLVVLVIAALFAAAWYALEIQVGGMR